MLSSIRNTVSFCEEKEIHDFTAKQVPSLTHFLVQFLNVDRQSYRWLAQEKEDPTARTPSTVPRIVPPSASPDRHVAIALQHNLKGLGLCHREPCTTVAENAASSSSRLLALFSVNDKLECLWVSCGSRQQSHVGLIVASSTAMGARQQAIPYLAETRPMEWRCGELAAGSLFSLQVLRHLSNCPTQFP